MSRLLFLLAFALGCTATVCAEDKPKPNALTPKEIAEGWILLFDGETAYGWKVDGEATVKDGVLHVGGAKASSATLLTEFGDYELRMETAPGSGRLAFPTAKGTSSFALTNQPMQITATIHSKPGSSSLSNSIEVGPDMVAKTTTEVTTDGLAKLRIESYAGGSVPVKSVKLRPLYAKPLFNGKNLDGWKVTQTDPKRTATKFEVTRDGELSVKNGPGDLQTEKQFDDFVLQFECKTNGKALNSGVFFRCIPDQYQNGYEAQIQNAYLGDRTKPIDFGTGAIYRRVAARKVVSNDNEWFTMALAARGAHIATWVNGYQTVDWTDDRKANDNPRQGLRTAKGPLSIQGHDPTTDLLFRNIRIAELPKP